MQCREHRDARIQSGEFVGDADAHAHRRAVGLARDVPEATHRFGDRAVARLPSHRSVLPVAADRKIDQRRFFGAQRLRIEPVLREPAGPEILDDDVDLEREFAHGRRIFGTPHVKRHQPFTAVVTLEPIRRSVRRARAPGSELIAAGRFDFPNRRAEIGQMARCGRPGDGASQFQYRNALETRLYFGRQLWAYAPQSMKPPLLPRGAFGSTGAIMLSGHSSQVVTSRLLPS